MKKYSDNQLKLYILNCKGQLESSINKDEKVYTISGGYQTYDNWRKGEEQRLLEFEEALVLKIGRQAYTEWRKGAEEEAKKCQELYNNMIKI